MARERTSLDANLQQKMTYENMMCCIDLLSEQFKFLGVSYLGESILGNGIPILSVGEGDKGILYVGAHHGMEWITTTVLLRFAYDLCRCIQEGGCMYRYSMPYLMETRCLYIVPMLNPDGVTYQIQGPAKDHPLYERLLKMNGYSDDFSHWQANARGVDLNHNYNSGFSEYKILEAQQGISDGASTRYSGTMPESEPEVGSLCNFIRFHEEIGMALTLHTQGEEIYYTSGGCRHPKSDVIAKAFARMSGYSVQEPQGMAAYGGMTDWLVGEMGRLCFTIECGKGSNPLPVDDAPEIYGRIREILFSAPIYL